MNIEMWPIDRPIPYPGNPRLNDNAVSAVAASIREFGWRQPIVVDAGGVVICGHTRLKAALSIGLDVVPVLVADDLTPEQVQAYRLADNKSSEAASWDMDLLPIELEELRAGGFDLDLIGFGSFDEVANGLLADVDEKKWSEEQENENGRTSIAITVTCPVAKAEEVKILAMSLATDDVKVFIK